MVIVSPPSRIVWIVPFIDGRTPWLIHGGDPNYLQVLGWPSKYATWMPYFHNPRAPVLPLQLNAGHHFRHRFPVCSQPAGWSGVSVSHLSKEWKDPKDGLRESIAVPNSLVNMGVHQRGVVRHFLDVDTSLLQSGPKCQAVFMYGPITPLIGVKKLQGNKRIFRAGDDERAQDIQNKQLHQHTSYSALPKPKKLPTIGEMV